MTRSCVVVTALLLVVASCGSNAVPLGEVSDLPDVTPQGLRTELEQSALPIVVNVWASWCAPCRSEAPLLRTAAAEWGTRVRFISVAVRDTREVAREFIAEFGLTALDHRFDRSGEMPRQFGGIGVPLTYFFYPGGELAHLQRGVIDERTLALWIGVIGGEG